jgi:hypothetical protein
VSDREEAVSTPDLRRLTAEVRDRLLADGAPLAGRCEEAAGDLAEAVAAAGGDASVVWGEYMAPCPDGHPTTGHCWVESGDAIADPTRAQFDDGPNVFRMDGLEARSYRRHYALGARELNATG